ncbi:MAG: diaminopimelate decarboxylase [Rickettsiales bacterium]
MDYFQYKQDALYAEDVAIEKIASEVGTPFYCYSSATLKRHYAIFDDALKSLKHRIFFAAKANSNPSVLKVLIDQGAGIDVVSAGEIRLAFMAGAKPSDIVFSGVGKTQEEMRFALERDIFQFNVESLPELELLNRVAESMGKIAPVAFRVNPDVDPKTHKKISTGKKESKFGIGLDEARAILARIKDFPAVNARGVSVHIGSQLTSLDPFEQAFRAVRAFIEELRAAGHNIETIDLGGGLGVPYKQDASAPPLPSAYGAMVSEVMKGLEGTFLFEPGRLIAGNAGILVTKVIYVKKTPNRNFVIVDAAMNDLIRPTLYEAHHDIVTVRKTNAPVMMADIVGPVCETGDVFAFDRAVPLVKPDDLIVFRTAGAYGAVMSCTYNARPLVPEVLVDGKNYKVIRSRPPYADMLAAYQMS